MGDRPQRPYGVALWGLRRALVESTDSLESLDEVKIVGVNNGKIYVWKKVGGKDAYVAHITPGMISHKKHAPYLIDPPDGTTDEQPAVGDIGDPANFSGNLGDVKQVDPDIPVPGVGDAAPSGWLPTGKLKWLAKKFKDLGLQPQNTFSKAVAAGEPVPDAMPEPAGLKGLADKQGIEVDDADLEPPEEPEDPKDDKPADDEVVTGHIENGDWAELEMLAKAGKIGAQGLQELMAVYQGAEGDEEHNLAFQTAKILADMATAAGDTKKADDWAGIANNHAAQDDDEQPGLDADLANAIMDKDWAKVASLAKTSGADDLETAAFETQAAASTAVSESNFGEAAAAAKAAAAIAKIQGNEKAAKGYFDLANSYAAAGGASDVPDPTPTEVSKAPAAVVAADEDMGFPWNPKITPASTPIVDEATSLAKQVELGIQPSQFIHEASDEIYTVTPFDPALEYIDPNGKPVNKKTGKLSGAKTIIPSGEALVQIPPEVVVPPPAPDAPKKKPAKKKVKKKAPPEATPPPTPESITPSKIKPGDVPQPVAPAAPPVVTKDMAAAAEKVALPEGMPEPSQLKLVGSGNSMGGAGDKNIYVDSKGNKWLHKLATAKGGGKSKPFAAVAQQVFSQVARMVNPDHLAIGVMTLDGQFGSLQPLVDRDPKQPDFSKTPVKKLTKKQQQAMLQEHMLDWMMSQHDSHRGQFIKGVDGTVYGVDKEQGFRFFGTDKLAINYEPNPETPVYNELWGAYAKGELDFDPMELKKTLEAIEGISSQEYIKTLKPYAETMWPKKPLEQAKFLKAARRRKIDMRKDFEGFITQLMRKRTKKDGNFNFETGWSGDKQSAKGPKVVKTKFKNTDYMAKVANENGFIMKTMEFYSDFDTKTVDPNKITLKVSKGNAAKAQEMLASLGIKPSNATAFSGPHYDMFFLDISQKDFDAGAIEVEEIVQPKKKGAIGKAPKSPHYFPNDHEHQPAKANSAEFQNIEATSFGVVPKRFESDGPMVEGSLTRARRWSDAQGPYYHVQFKLRPHVWEGLLGGGSGASYKYPSGSYDAKSDSFKESGAASEMVPTRKWAAGNSEIHLATASKEPGGKWKAKKYVYMGAVNAKVRPKPGQTVAQATAELLEKMKPGLSKEIMRDATPEEKEVHTLSQAMWAYLPQKADKLGPEDKRDPKKMRAALKKAGVTPEQIKGIKHVEVLPGYSTHVDPGRSKRLKEKGMLFPSHGIRAENIVSILEKGALGIHERNSAGIANVGFSENQDTISGSGEGVLGHVWTEESAKKNQMPSKSGVSFTFDAQLIIAPEELDRLDTYLHYGDSYGCCTPYGTSYGSAKTWNQRRTMEKQIEDLNKPSKHGVKGKGAPLNGQEGWQHHEVSFKRGVAPERILRVHANSEQKRVQMIKALLAKGVNEVNGVPVEDFVVAGLTVKQIHEKYVKPMESEA
jgi:hypothetical protein